MFLIPERSIDTPMLSPRLIPDPGSRIPDSLPNKAGREHIDRLAATGNGEESNTCPSSLLVA